MSVYKRPGAENYSYDFEVGGHRFSGDTGTASKRKALHEQEIARTKAKAAQKQAQRAGAELTLGEANIRYMDEVGRHQTNALTTIACLEWIEATIGRNISLSLINDNIVAKMVAKRRAMYRRVGNKKTPKKLVGPATVNRTAIEPLRKVMIRAARTWKVPTGDVTWRQHMLKEPRERVREASSGEEADIMAKLGPGYADAVRFAFLNGCRRMEIVGLRWAKVDFFGRQFTVRGKANKERTIPMSQATFDLLWSLRGNHEEFVFTYVAKRTDARKRLVKGKRYLLTDSGLKTAMKRAVDAAGIENLRFHDARHTAATRVLRKSNLKVVQNLLGHERITTTEKYAHAVAEDIRAALEAATPTENPTGTGEGVAKRLTDNG